MQGVTSWLANNYLLIIVIVALLAIVIVPSQWRRFQANRKAKHAMLGQLESAAPQNGSTQQAPPVIKPKVKQPNNHVPVPSTPSLDDFLNQTVAKEVQKQIKPLSDKVDGIVKSLQNFRDSLS